MTFGVAQAGHSDDSTPGPNTDSSQPRLAELVQDQQQEAQWRQEVLDLLKQVVLIQKEVAKGQVQVVQLLGMLGTQVSQVCFGLSLVSVQFS